MIAVVALSAGAFAAAGNPAAQAAPAAVNPAAQAAAGGASPAPGPAPIPGSLSGVSADSATDAWAVGNFFTSAGVSQTLIVHWNGTAWSQVSSPNPGPGGDVLAAVSAVSPTDAWAAGLSYNKTSNVASTLILHWNGTAWSPVKSPDPSAAYNAVSGVSAVSATDAWAVGNYETPDRRTNKSLVLHWNGTTWSKAQAPSPGASSPLYGVSAVSRTDAWAVGVSTHKASQATTLALHWNGTAWQQVPTPNPLPNGNLLSAVSAASGTDAWAIGGSLPLRWNGTAWSQVTLPSQRGELDGVSAVSRTDAWLVGTVTKPTKFDPSYTETLRWNGTAWSRVPSPSPGTSGGQGTSELFGVDALSSTDAWAVGTYADGTYALILHWNGTAWSVM